MKKKAIISGVLVLCLVAWCVRYYTFNGTFKLHSQCEREYYSANETIVFDEDTMTYGVYTQPGYSICLKGSRIVELDNYLAEISKTTEDFSNTSEKYIELTFEIANTGDFEGGLSLYGLPIVGENWYTFYDAEMTVYINEFENEVGFIDSVIIPKGKTATVKVAYNLNSKRFLPNTFENIKNEKMWVWASVKPTERYIRIR